MDLFKILKSKAKRNIKTIILPESYDKRVLDAAKIILNKKLAKLILIQRGSPIPLKPSKGLAIIDIGFSQQFVKQYYDIRKKKAPKFKIEVKN